jgi:NADPH-dependent curcumin reductase CurA
VEWLTKLWFDAAINYKTAKDLSAEIKASAPKGADIFFGKYFKRLY